MRGQILGNFFKVDIVDNGNGPYGELVVSESQRIYDKKSDKKRETVYWDIRCTEQRAVFIRDNFTKGQAIFVDGEVTRRTVLDQASGKKVVYINMFAERVLFVPRDYQNKTPNINDDNQNGNNSSQFGSGDNT